MAVNLQIVRELVEAESLSRITDISQENQITCPYDLPMDWRIEFEERAAILEYDGRLTREMAEKQALQEILIRMNPRE
ncbi:MAG: hypothetical protein AMJ75_01320 [Phycisphaerae bacterium SM1_79]|nr:MAG: hypothetical protein AMJ75_01320 [Phycisphaerae bacterium SM1_79]